MSYIDLNWDFSQFDRDNMHRYMTAIYVNQANQVLAAIYKSPRAGMVRNALLAADARAAAALAAYQAMAYPAASGQAKAAYDGVLAAAAKIGVKIEPQAWQADYKAKGTSSKFVDPVDYHRNAP